MLFWIVVAVVVTGLVVYAFWPRRRGVVDGDALRSRRRDHGKGEQYNDRSGPNFGGF
jgi:hypothetical protein